LLDEGLSTMREEFLANRQTSLLKILSADQLMAQQSTNQSLVAALGISYAVLYFCTMPPHITLSGTELEVRELKGPVS
jgi:hypothetical protein